MNTVFKLGFALSALLLPLAAHTSDWCLQLDTRYAPHADWSGLLDLASHEHNPSTFSVWWRSPDEIRAARAPGARPLSGLHLALDPGHIGADWAEAEGRHFKMNERDYAVREGELVLEVAQRVRDALVQLGAEVSLLREANQPVNPREPIDYLDEVVQATPIPEASSLAALVDYSAVIRQGLLKRSVVRGELIERARLVNEVLQPDAILSLHINAAPWPRDAAGERVFDLVDANHTHVLIFGCLSEAELSSSQQRAQLLEKLSNGSGAIEKALGQSLGVTLGQASDLPASKYEGQHAVRLPGATPYLWARNLMLLRQVKCPIVLLEPYIANSKVTYARLQQALDERARGADLSDDDILIEYAGAVVEGVLAVYGSGED